MLMGKITNNDSPLKVLKEKFKRISPLLLSHHPICSHYKNHVLLIGNLKLCIGCFIGYPVAFSSLFLFYYVIFPRSNYKMDWIWLGLGILGFLMIFLSFSPYSEKKLVKIYQKATVGFGGAVIMAFIISFFEVPSFFRFFLHAWGIGCVLVSPVALIRYKGMVDKCEVCKDRNNPQICPMDSYSLSKNPKTSIKMKIFQDDVDGN